ncbi:hypothetical protein AC1031_008452 [Aphanomyces cochlioides]|nr:hypothetical protein AC1031_008452 [Aphanomyces cochlioides]
MKLYHLFALPALGAAEVLVSLPINVDGSLKNLELMRGQTFERAALSFMEMNGLISDGVESQRSQEIISQLAGMLRENTAQQREIIVSVPLTIDGVEQALTLYRDESTPDAVARFLRDAAMTEDAKLQAHPQLLELLNYKLTELNADTQQQEVIVSMPLTLAGVESTLTLYRGETVDDAVTRFLRDFPLSDADKAQARPQLAQLLTNKVAESSSQQEPPPQEVLVSIPLTLGGVESTLTLSRGQSVIDAVERFLGGFSIADADRNQVRGELQQLLSNKVAELNSAREAILTIPLTIAGADLRLTLFEGEQPSDAITRFLDEARLSPDARAQARPQLDQLISTRLAELRQTRQEPVFEFDLTIDGRATTVRHFEGVDPLVEARAFAASLGITNEDVLTRFLPQVASEIQKRIDGLSTQAEAKKELFSIPLTVNNQAVVLVHYQGMTPTESAVNFLQQNGITDANVVDSYLPQIVELINSRLGQEETRKPLVSFPITIGDREQTCNYFEGDSPEVTAQLFLEANGLTNNPNYAAFVQEISLRIRKGVEEIQAAAAAAKPREPLFTLPMKLGDETFDIAYHKDEDPAAIATEFCTSKMTALSSAMGRTVAAEEMQQCKVVVFQTLTRALDEMEAKAVVPPQVASTEAKELLFTLDIDLGEGKNAALPYYAGDDEVDVATQFCVRNNVDEEAVPVLIEAIRNQLAQP